MSLVGMRGQKAHYGYIKVIQCHDQRRSVEIWARCLVKNKKMIHVYALFFNKNNFIRTVSLIVASSKDNKERWESNLRQKKKRKGKRKKERNWINNRKRERIKPSSWHKSSTLMLPAKRKKKVLLHLFFKSEGVNFSPYIT